MIDVPTLRGIAPDDLYRWIDRAFFEQRISSGTFEIDSLGRVGSVMVEPNYAGITYMVAQEQL